MYPEIEERINELEDELQQKQDLADDMRLALDTLVTTLHEYDVLDSRCANRLEEAVKNANRYL